MKKTVLLTGIVMLAVALAAPATASEPTLSTAKRMPQDGIMSNSMLRAFNPAFTEEGGLPVWVTKSDMITPVDTPGGGAWDPSTSTLYVPGGYSAAGVHASMQSWASGTDTWTDETEKMPVVDDLVVFGWAEGAICRNPATGLVHVVNGVDGTSLYAAHQVYDPSAPLGSRWSAGTVPVVLDPGGDPALDVFYFSQSSVCAWLGGKMILSGGFGLTDTLTGIEPAVLVPDTWSYDPVADTWSDTGALMPDPVLWSAYTPVVGVALAVSGGTNDLATLATTASVQAFLSTTGTWITLPSLLTSRMGHGMGTLGLRIVVYGGATGDGITGFILDPSTDTCVVPACTWVSPGVIMNGSNWFFGWGSSNSVPNLGIAAGGVGALGSSAVTEAVP